jgi:hypothetical protein
VPFDRLTALSFAEGFRYAYHPSLQRIKKYASFLVIAQALRLNIFEQPVLIAVR